MFIDFSINRELAFKVENFYLSTQLTFPNTALPVLIDFKFINFSKPKLFYFSADFFPFLILSNGSLVFVEFSFNKVDCGTLLFDDLY